MTAPCADEELDVVAAEILRLDPNKIGQLLRDTLDQLYDGQSTLVEINLQRTFRSHFSDGVHLDYKIAGIEVDCKYSQKLNRWMIPREAIEHLRL